MSAAPRSVSTYDDAQWWLLANVPEDDIIGVLRRGRALTLSMRLVCDVFWVAESKLKADLLRKWQEVGG